MKILSASTFNNLVSKFSEKSLPKTEWTHQAHIMVAFWHLHHYDFDQALNLVRSSIKAYNLSVGTMNTNDAGYHETLTIFWMTLAHKYLLRNSSFPIEMVCQHFLHSAYASPTYPFTYYTRDLLFSTKARKEWVDGDIQPFSSLEIDTLTNE